MQISQRQRSQLQALMAKSTATTASYSFMIINAGKVSATITTHLSTYQEPERPSQLTGILTAILLGSTC